MTIVSIKSPHEVSLSGSPMQFVFAISPYSSIERNQDIRLQIKVMVEEVYNSGNFTEVRNQVFYPTEAGMIRFSVSSIIDTYLTYYMPRLSLTKPVSAVGQRKRYKVDYIATVNNSILSSGSSSILSAIKGGIAYDQISPKKIFDQIIGQGMPLHFVVVKKVFATDYQFLFWTFNGTPNAPQEVIATVYYNDGTTQVVALADKVTCGKWGVCCVPAGFNQLGLHTYNTTKFAVRYSLKVTTATGTVVPEYFYTLEHRNFYATQTLVYRNSIGGVETLTLRSAVDMEADYIQQQAQRISPDESYVNLLLQARIIHTATEETVKYKGDTGWITKAHADALRDFFLSNDRYEVRSTALIPIEVIVKNAKFFSNRDNLISISLEWQNAFSNLFYTPQGLLSYGSCPAVKLLDARQVSKTILQIMWAIEEPYDAVQVELTVGTDTQLISYAGNVGSRRQTFANPNNLTQVTVRCRTVCDADAGTFGAWLTQVVAILTNQLVVAADDYFNIEAGYNSSITLPYSVLANDYDPDGSGIQAINTSGATQMGGTYSISNSGMVQYQPPSAAFVGQDHFDYGVYDVSIAFTVTARCYINVGGVITGTSAVYAKVVVRNTTGSSNNLHGEVWVDFFSDPQGSQPVDVTSKNLTINTMKRERDQDYNGNLTTNNTPQANAGTGTKIKVFEGTLAKVDYGWPTYGYDIEYNLHYTTEAGTGYQGI